MLAKWRVRLRRDDVICGDLGDEAKRFGLESCQNGSASRKICYRSLVTRRTKKPPNVFPEPRAETPPLGVGSAPRATTTRLASRRTAALFRGRSSVP
ncbi:unnamed protein product [Caenorhabditis auriculariae]|uniref:Uncharacterized protein n=1 Tax=Caenorhabditis auriculariae TaxID=2777116 RepID=A0A8S1HWE8_9PELO|nr:unnamed protein product [Caenorhabditis auriculariae]